MGRGLYTFFTALDPWTNFSSRHIKYMHPRYILENDNVTLQGITETHAFFCVTDPAKDIYNMKEFPFAFIFQFLEAKQMVILPNSSFIKLAQEAGDPGKNYHQLITNGVLIYAIKSIAVKVKQFQI